MDNSQISALEGMVNFGSSGASGGGLGLAFADLGAAFTAFFSTFRGVAFCGGGACRPAVVPTGEGGAVTAPAVDPEDGPLLAAFGSGDAVGSSSIFQRDGPMRHPVPRTITSPVPGRLYVRRYWRHGMSGDV